jgi:hypothetical protein
MLVNFECLEQGAELDQIVIARFKEDVSWVNLLDNDWEIFIYNKGSALGSHSFKENVRIINIPNVGRETETYLSHIRNNDFSRTHGKVVFTQANPFEHSPDFLKLLALRRLWSPVQTLAFQWVDNHNVPPPSLLHADTHEYIEGCRIRSERYSLHTWAPLSFFDQGAWNVGSEYKNRHYLVDGINIAEHFYTLLGLDEYAGMAAGHEFGVFSYGAVFSVESAAVQAFKEQLGGRIDHLLLISRADKIYGYIFERCWLHLFGLEYIKFRLK